MNNLARSERESREVGVDAARSLNRPFTWLAMGGDGLARPDRLRSRLGMKKESEQRDRVL